MDWQGEPMKESEGDEENGKVTVKWQNGQSELGESERGSGGKLEWRVTEKKGDTHRGPIYLFTEKLNDGLTEEYSE